MNCYLDALVAVDETQDVQKLALVLVNALDLHIKKCVLTNLKQEKHACLINIYRYTQRLRNAVPEQDFRRKEVN